MQVSIGKHATTDQLYYAKLHAQCGYLVPFVGIELTTYRLQGGCSTTELKRRNLILLDDLKVADFTLRDGHRISGRLSEFAKLCGRMIAR